jgi:hypothetical protein
VPPLTAERIAEPLRKQRLGLEGNDAGAEQVKDPAAVSAIGAHVEHEVAGRDEIPVEGRLGLVVRGRRPEAAAGAPSKEMPAGSV